MQENLMWTLKQLYLSLEQYGRIQMKDFDLSPTQSVVLHYLLTQKEQAVYAVDLHEILGISKSSVSSALKSLKQKGYLTTVGEPADDRKKRIALTQKAIDMEKAIETSLQEQQMQLFQEIPPQRLKWLENDLTVMLMNIRNESGLEEPL
mgnify:CR=1 FL=1